MDIPNANCEPFLGKTERDLLAGILLASGGTAASIPNTAACAEWGWGKYTVRDMLAAILQAVQNGNGNHGHSKVTISTTAPTHPHNEDLWWNPDDGSFWIYYDDGVSPQWFQIN